MSFVFVFGLVKSEDLAAVNITGLARFSAKIKRWFAFEEEKEEEEDDEVDEEEEKSKEEKLKD